MQDLYLQEKSKSVCFYFHKRKLKSRNARITEMNFEIVTGLGVVPKQNFIKALIHLVYQA